MTDDLTSTECQFALDRGEGMSHSIRSYLQRRTTEELENILTLYAGETASELNREVVKITIGILAEREAYLPEEFLGTVRACLENR